MPMRNGIQNGPVPPRVSVVITVTDGTPHLRRCLDALHRQRGGMPAEIVVPVYSWENYADVCRAYPDVRFVIIEDPRGAARDRLEHLLYDERRAVGLSATTGDIIAMTEDHAMVDEDWCARIITAHQQPYGAIGGSVRYAGRHILNLATYLLDFGRYQHPQRGPANYITDINVSYKRAALEHVRDVWQTLYHETWVHDTLRQRGETLWLEPAIAVHHDRGDLALTQLLFERFKWARLYGGRRASSFTGSTRALYALMCPLLPFLFLARQFVAASNLRSLCQLLAVLPVLGMLTVACAAGEFVGYVTARPVGDGESPSLTSAPVRSTLSGDNPG